MIQLTKTFQLFQFHIMTIYRRIAKCFLRKNNVKVVFRINSKLDRFIVLGKDAHEIGEHNVVYKISCNCGKCYVGQTKRPLRIRIDEHAKNFNLNEKFHNVISKPLKSMKVIKRITFLLG